MSDGILKKKSTEELRQLAGSKEPQAAAARTELGNRRKEQEKPEKKPGNRSNTPTGRR